MGVRLACQMEDAEGVHIVDTCFSGSLRAEITHLARTLCAAPCQSAFCIYTKINTRVGYFPDSARLCHVADVHVANIILVIRRGEKNKPPQHCKLLL